MRYARPSHYAFDAFERAEINRIGSETGCHSCGVKHPLTRSGNWICDPQPPSSVKWGQGPQRIYPHCLPCKKKQGRSIREFVLKQGLPPLTGIDVPGCVLFISDTHSAMLPPEIQDAGNVWANADCIAVGCLSYMNGAPEVELIASDDAIAREPPVFDGWIDTPNRCLSVLTQDNEALLTESVPDIRTRIRVWTNHDSEPDLVIVGFDAGI